MTTLLDLFLRAVLEYHGWPAEEYGQRHEQRPAPKPAGEPDPGEDDEYHPEWAQPIHPNAKRLPR